MTSLETQKTSQEFLKETFEAIENTYRLNQFLGGDQRKFLVGNLSPYADGKVRSDYKAEITNPDVDHFICTETLNGRTTRKTETHGDGRKRIIVSLDGLSIVFESVPNAMPDSTTLTTETTFGGIEGSNLLKHTGQFDAFTTMARQQGATHFSRTIETLKWTNGVDRKIVVYRQTQEPVIYQERLPY